MGLIGRSGSIARHFWGLGILVGCGPAIEASEADTDATAESSSDATTGTPDASTTDEGTSSETTTAPTSSSEDATTEVGSSSGGSTTSGVADASSTGSGPVVCHVPSVYADPQSAIDDPACDIIELESGTYWGSLVVERDVEIRGNGSVLRPEEERSGSVITIGPDVAVRIDLLTIRGGDAYEGGGIYNAGSLELEGVILAYNTAQRAGAGIYSTGALTIVEGYFEDNYAGPGAEVLGGAVCVEGADLVVEDTLIWFNQANANESDALAGGGAIAVRNGTAVLRGQTSLEDNSASVYDSPALEGEVLAAGGGVYVDASTLLIEPDVEIYDNLAEVWLSSEGTGLEPRAEGGGIFVRGGSVDATGPAWIDWNFASVGTVGAAQGGAVHIREGSEARFESVEMTQNGVLSEDWLAEWDGEISGGAIAVQQQGAGESRLELELVFLHVNRAGLPHSSLTGRGGAIALHASDGGFVTAHVEDTTIADNRLYAYATGTGGGLDVRSDGNGSQALVEMLNTTLSGNAVETIELARAGGMALTAAGGASASALLRSVTLYGNTVDSDMNASAPGLMVDAQDSSSATIEIGGSVLHGHLGEDCTCVGGGSVTATAPNAWGDPAGCPSLNVDDAWIGPDPMLGPLADTGGPTPVHLPAMASPLLDALPVDTCVDHEDAALATDQRGLPRPQATACDLGAVERQPLDP